MFANTLRSPRVFFVLVGAAPMAYFSALAALSALPYRVSLLPLAGACIAVAGMISGSFFLHARARFSKVRLLFFHENNGFILGILVSLLGSVFAGRALLTLSPALGLLPVAGCSRRIGSSALGLYGQRQVGAKRLTAVVDASIAVLDQDTLLEGLDVRIVCSRRRCRP